MQEIKFTCSRCGKVQFVRRAYNGEIREIHNVAFLASHFPINEDEICENCYNDFLELANNFFDEVNRQ